MTQIARTAPSPAPMRVRLIQAHLLQLGVLIDGSAALAYSRRLNLPESARAPFFLIGVYRGLTATEIATFSGSEKAQISRSIKVLAEAGLVERPGGLRGRIRLSKAGERMFSDILRIADERNEVLSQGFSRDEIKHFVALTRRLIDRAAMLYAAEGLCTQDVSEPVPATFHPPTLADASGRITAEGVLFNRMIMPGLQSLTTYLKRSGAQVFKREFGLSNFEWQVLSQIGEYQPIRLNVLTDLVGRDKSQVGRTVKQLQKLALVQRRDHGRASITLTLTDRGAECYLAMCDVAVQRDNFLFAQCSLEERAFYIASVDRLIANARRLFAAEQSGSGAPAANVAMLTAPPELVALQEENTRLKRLLADVMLENSLLKERAI